MRFKKILSLLTVMSMLFSCIGITAFAEDSTTSTVVAKIGDNAYADLATAVSEASNDDVILLYESVDNIPEISKPLTIKAAVDGVAVNGGIAERFATVNGTVIFEGITFNDRVSTEGASTDQSEMTLKFVDCTFNVPTGNTYAIQAGASWNNDVTGALVVEDCTFNTEATSFIKGYMVYAQCVESVTVTGSTFDGGNAYRGAIHTGDSTVYATTATISGNTFKNFARAVQVGNRVEGSEIVIDDNDFSGIAAIDGESESAVLYIHEVADAATTDVEVTNNDIADENTLVILSENDTGAVTDFVSAFEGNTKNSESITFEGNYNDAVYVSAATVTVYSFEELKAAIANGGEIVLANDIETTEAIVTSGVTATIDLNGKALNVRAGDNKFNDATNLTIKNGNINIDGTAVNGNAIFCLDEYEKDLVTTVTLDNVNLTGSDYSSAYGVFYIGASSVLNVNGGVWNLSNDLFAAGGVFKADSADATLNITDADMTLHNVRRVVTYADTTIDSSKIAISGDADGVDAEMEHGFNRSPLTVTNSSITMENLVGRGITAECGAVSISDNSTVTIINAQEATIDVRAGQTVTVSEDSTVKVDVAPTITSGTISGAIETAPTGKLNTGYISTGYIGGIPAVYGEATGVVATESFVVKLYSDETLVGTAALVDNDKVLLNGESKTVTWHAALSDDGDSWWSAEWENGALNINALPNRAELWVDGEKVSEDEVQLNISDLKNPICAAVTDDNGNVKSFVAGTGYLNGVGTNAPAYDDALETALKDGGNITLLRDVKLTRAIKVNGASFTLDGNGNSVSGNGVLWFLSGNYDIKNLVFDNLTTDGYGVLEFTYAQANVSDCTFTNNNAPSCIAVDTNANSDGNSVVTIDGCTFTGNNCSTSVINSAEGATTVQNSVITDNTANIAVIYNSANCNVTGNVFSGNTLTGENANKAVILTGPWVAGEYTVNITENAFLDAEYVAVYVENWAEEYSAVSTNVLNGNYWIDGDEPEADKDYKIDDDAKVTLDNYYAEYSSGTLGDLTMVSVTGLSGSGTAEAPYLISNIEELKWFRDDVNAGNTYSRQYVQLTADIDLESVENWEPIGNSTNKFLGHFDGGNKTISNLKINNTNSYVGFFGYTSTGSLKNLTLENVDIDARLGVGALVGCPFTSDIENIKLIGKVTIDAAFYVGGVAGRNAYGDLIDITVDVTEGSYVNADSIEDGKSYRTYVGGVVGFLGEGNGLIKDVTSNIKVIGNVQDIGGIAGIAHYGNTFENVTFSGSVEASEGAVEVGGIAGVWHNQEGQVVTFTDVNVSENATVTVGEEDVTETNGLVGGAYNSENETPDKSGSLIVDGEEAWLKVAQIGDIKYSSLQEAIAAANGGDTVTLMCDIEVTGTVVVDKDVTIDLNGKTITNIGGSDNHTFRIAADVIVKNGTIDNTAGGYCFIIGYNTPQAGNLTIESGSYYGNTTVVSVTYGSVTIEDGYFQATPYQGSYDYTINCVDRYYKTGEAKVVVKGGSFYNFNPSDNAAEGESTNYVAEGYEGVNLGDGTFGVQKIQLFDFFGSNVKLGNSLAMNFAVDKSNLTGTDYYAVIEHTTDTEVETINVPFEEWTSDGNYYVITYSGIVARQITDDISITIYNKDGIQASVKREDGLKAYAMRMLGNSSEIELKTLLVDMLNYGAAAQLEFNYKTDKLANADLTAEQKAYASEMPSITNKNERDSEKCVGSNLILVENIKMNMAFKGITEGMYVEYEYTNHYGEKMSKRVDYSDLAVNNEIYRVLTIDAFVIADADQIVTATVYNSDGSVYTVCKDSMNSYLARQLTNGDLESGLYSAIAKFTASSYNYLH